MNRMKTMRSMTDEGLLRAYAQTKSEAAFAELAGRHLNWVYSTACRIMRDPHLAEDVTQSVFVLLARKATSLNSGVVLGGWLFRTTRFVAIRALRTEKRRREREQTMFAMNSTAADPDESGAVWNQLAPCLDQAVADLPADDRAAVLLRFYQQKPLREVGLCLGISEEAAKKRVSRAIEKMRKVLVRRGVVPGSAALASMLASRTVQAAPESLVASVVKAPLAGVSGPAPLPELARQTIEAWGWARFKLAFGVLAFSGLLLIVLVQSRSWLEAADEPRIAAAASTTTVPSSPRNAPDFPPRSDERAGNEPRADGGADALCALTGPVGSVLVQPDGRIVISGGGATWFYSPVSGLFGTLNGTVLRFDSEGSVDPGFGCVATPPNYVSVFETHLAGMPDGRLLMAGPFRKVDDKPRPGVAVLLSDGKLDSNFIPWRGETNEVIGGPRLPGWRQATVASDGKVWAQSLLSRTTGWSMCQLEGDGSVGEARRLDAGPTGVPLPVLFGERGFEMQAVGRSPGSDAFVALRGCLEQVPLELCRYAVRLPDGGAILLVREGDAGRLVRFDKDWQPDFSYTNRLRARGYVSLALQGEGELLVARGSELRDLDGGDPGGVVRLKKDGSVDRSFRCETDERVMSLAVQPDGCIIIGGFFRKVNGMESPWLARLQPNGALDENFRRHFTTPGELIASRRVPVRAIGEDSAPQAGAGASVDRGPGAAPGFTGSFVVILSLELAGGVATVQFEGAPGQTYVLQATDRLGGAEWSNVSTNRTDASGLGRFRDESAANSPMRFYRVASQF